MLTTLKTVIKQSRTLSQVEIVTVTDRYSQKEVIAEIVVEGLGPRTLILWRDIEGDLAYTQAGQYTDTDIIKRVRDLLDSQLK